MLHEFLVSNREELIARCREKAAKRFDFAEVPDAFDQGIPLFLDQLSDALRVEAASPTHAAVEPQRAPAPTVIGRAAALHGAELLRQGYSVDQVVHDYGDVCQAVTEMAIERNAPVATNEFRILNRSLDNAIADAVTAYGKGRQAAVDQTAEVLSERLDSFSEEQVRLLDTAVESFTALQTGRLGLNGSTAMVHLQSLQALRALALVSLSAVRLESAKTTLAPPKGSG
jgi:hypothetical protein